MEIAKIQVSGVRATKLWCREIPHGIIGAKVAFEFDPTWQTLRKTVVFKGCCTKDVLDAGDVVTIPAEVVANPGARLSVGIYGTDAAGSIAIPTVWAELGIIRYAADPADDPSTDPTLPVWAQLRDWIGDMTALETAAKDNLVAAINEAYGGAGGNMDPVTASIYAGVEAPADGLVWIDTAEEDSCLELDGEKWVNYYWCSASGGLSGNGSDTGNGIMMCLSFVPVKAGKKYTIYSTDPDWTCDWIGVNLYELDDGIHGFVKRVTGSGATMEITIPENVAYLIFSARNLVENDAYRNIRIREESEAHTHSYTPKVTKTATCTTAGTKTYTCECGESYTEMIPATGHNFIDGVCAICGAVDPAYNPNVTLTSISATYSGGSVAVGTAVTALAGIVVTATYSDGSTATVTGYTLSGTIAEGSNTVTVNYGGKTTTFSVTGVAESIPETGGWKVGYFTTTGDVNTGHDGGEMYNEDYIPVTAGDVVYFCNENARWSTTKPNNGQKFNRAVYYDAEKKFVKQTSSQPSTVCELYKYEIPEGVSFVRVCAGNMDGYADTAYVSTEIPNFERIFADVVWQTGYFNASGGVVSTTTNGEMASTLISVEPGATYRFGNSNSSWTTDWNRCIYYTNMATVKQAVQPANGATLEFTIPADVHYLTISCRRLSDAYITATFVKIS